MSQSNNLHNSKHWEVSVTDSSGVTELISKAHQAGPTKDDLLAILEQFQKQHNQFKTEFSTRLTDIRRSLLNISLPSVSDDWRPDEKNVVEKFTKTVTTNHDKKIDRKIVKTVEKKVDKHHNQSVTLKSKPIAKPLTALPDLMMDDSDASENVKPIKSGGQTIAARTKTVKGEVRRPQSAMISSTVTSEMDLSKIKSPLARQILKRRQTACDVLRPDPLPNDARAMSIKKRRISHAAANASNTSPHDVLSTRSSVKFEQEPATKRESDFFFGFSDQKDDQYQEIETKSENISASDKDDDSNKMAKWPGSPIGNISEIAKMVLALQAQKKRNDSQAAQSTNNDGSNVAPRADKVQLSNDPFDF